MERAALCKHKAEDVICEMRGRNCRSEIDRTRIEMESACAVLSGPLPLLAGPSLAGNLPLLVVTPPGSTHHSATFYSRGTSREGNISLLTEDDVKM